MTLRCPSPKLWGAEMTEVLHLDDGVTHLPDRDFETIETDKTYSISNDEFMRVVFSDVPEGARPVVASFIGDPKHPPKGAFSVKPWFGRRDELARRSGQANNYFSLSTYFPDDKGRFRRRKERFAALHAVMLDDVGEKGPLDALALPPSLLLETSSGNYQATYLLAVPITDADAADDLMKAFLAKDISDPGAGGVTARLARQPVGSNGKHNPLFAHRVDQWNPDRRYTVDELVDAFQLKLRPADKAKVRHSQYVEGGNSVLTSPPTQNLVLVELEKRGALKGKLDGGKHDITCPWVKEHTDEVDGGTVYYEPDAAHPLGGFKCLHGHCVERHLVDLLKEFNLDECAVRSKASIRVEPGNVHLIVDAAERVLAASGAFFQSGNRIVEVVSELGTRQVSICPVGMSELVKLLSKKVDWLRFDGRNKLWCQIDPPHRILTILLESNKFNHLPVLKGIANQPYYRSDWSLVRKSGYDATSCIYGAFDDQAFNVLDHPTKADAEAALKELKAILSEFSFLSDLDFAAALAGMLTAVVRPTLPHAPMIHARAHMPGSGKSYLQLLLSILASPQLSSPLSFGASEPEFRKKFFAELLMAPAVINYDNLTSDLVAHGCLCTALASEYISDRILGASKTIKVSTRTLMLSSGNNVGPVEDLARRTITINLDPRCEMPATRDFARPSLFEEVQANRAYFVSQVLTIVQAWICADKPKAKCRSISGFDMWSMLCRQPLLWLGEVDPALSLIQGLEEDPARETLRRFHLCWRYEFGEHEGTVRRLLSPKVPLDLESIELREVIEDIALDRDGINRRKLGWWIKRHAGQVVDGWCFEKVEGTRSSDAWRLVKRG